MELSSISLNTLRAFEAAARHLSFSRAAEELCVTPAAVSHQVKSLEDTLCVPLFRRTSRGIALTDEGSALFPILSQGFVQFERALGAVSGGSTRHVLHVGAVGTFALGFLLDRLPGFQRLHPDIDIRLHTNNNAVDLWTENLDCAVRFGDGNWHGVKSTFLMHAPVSPLCHPTQAAKLAGPASLKTFVLLRSYRMGDWPAWFKAAREEPVFARGPMFDASHLMVQAAMRGHGVALAPPAMFRRELDSGDLVRPFDIEADVGAYWLTRLSARTPNTAEETFCRWLSAAAAGA